MVKIKKGVHVMWTPFWLQELLGMVRLFYFVPFYICVSPVLEKPVYLLSLKPTPDLVSLFSLAFVKDLYSALLVSNSTSLPDFVVTFTFFPLFNGLP